jgi:PadR family transcriptional regulator PadR
MSVDKQLVKGTLKTVVLQILSKKDAHGYEIATKIKEISSDQFSITEGTLYPMLHSLVADGAIESNIEDTPGKRKRKVYKITAQGRKLLEDKKKQWLDFSSVMDNVMASFQSGVADEVDVN